MKVAFSGFFEWRNGLEWYMSALYVCGIIILFWSRVSFKMHIIDLDVLDSFMSLPNTYNSLHKEFQQD